MVVVNVIFLEGRLDLLALPVSGRYYTKRRAARLDTRAQR
jgi:hypothetical protein